MNTHQTEFVFAGFTWPRDVADMAIGRAALKRKHGTPRCTGNYYHAPTPNTNADRGFYFLSDGAIGTNSRYVLTGATWSTDDTEFSGFILRLPHGRFLAGWTMGGHMASTIDREVFTSEDDAVARANDMAERAADDEAVYQAQEREREAQEDAEIAVGDEG